MLEADEERRKVKEEEERLAKQEAETQPPIVPGAPVDGAPPALMFPPYAPGNQLKILTVYWLRALMALI